MDSSCFAGTYLRPALSRGDRLGRGLVALPLLLHGGLGDSAKPVGSANVGGEGGCSHASAGLSS